MHCVSVIFYTYVILRDVKDLYVILPVFCVMTFKFHTPVFVQEFLVSAFNF